MGKREAEGRPRLSAVLSYRTTGRQRSAAAVRQAVTRWLSSEGWAAVEALRSTELAGGLVVTWRGPRETETFLSRAEWNRIATLRHLRVDEDLAREVDEVAGVLGASRSSIVRAALAWQDRLRSGGGGGSGTRRTHRTAEARWFRGGV